MLVNTCPSLLQLRAWQSPSFADGNVCSTSSTIFQVGRRALSHCHGEFTAAPDKRHGGSLQHNVRMAARYLKNKYEAAVNIDQNWI